MAKKDGENGAAVAVNRFRDIFTGVAFTAPRGKSAEPYTFEKGKMAGTVQYRLANAIVHLGKDTGAVIDGCSVVIRKYPKAINGGKSEMLFTWPQLTVGGPVRQPVFDTSDSPAALADLNAIGHEFLMGPFQEWQRERKANGAIVGSGSGITGVDVSDELLKQFGLV